MKRLDRHAHWEIRRGDHSQAKAYCSKEETRKDVPGNLVKNLDLVKEMTSKRYTI